MSEDLPPPYSESSQSDLGAVQQPPPDLGAPPGDEKPFCKQDWLNIKAGLVEYLTL